MALLDLLKKQGSILNDLNGKTPTSYNGVSNYQNDLKTSILDLDGKTPTSYTGISNYKTQLQNSILDLDGKTPTKYLDNLPK